MRMFSAVIALCVLSAGPAFAQSGYDTGAGRASGATTNSGSARPDVSSNRAEGRIESPSGTARPTTSGSGASGERGARPDAKPVNMPNNRKSSTTPKRGTTTQTDD